MPSKKKLWLYSRKKNVLLGMKHFFSLSLFVLNVALILYIINVLYFEIYRKCEQLLCVAWQREVPDAEEEESQTEEEEEEEEAAVQLQHRLC